MTIHAVKTAIPVPYEEIASFCKKYHVVKMWLFGSVLRDDFTPESDIDIMVEFDPDHVPGWEFYGSWPDELEAIFCHKVDLGTPKSLRPWVKDRIMAGAQVIYERPE